MSWRASLVLMMLIAVLIVIFGLARASDWPTSIARGAVGFNLPGKPATGEIHRFILPWTMQVPANYSAAGAAVTSKCSCKVAPSDADYVISIKYNDATAKSACTVPNTMTVGAFGSVSTFTMHAGDSLSVVAPTQDSTASDCSVTIGVSQ